MSVMCFPAVSIHTASAVVVVQTESLSSYCDQLCLASPAVSISSAFIKILLDH